MKFQEVVEGNLSHLLRETAEQFNRKFFIKPIDFEGLQRVEKDEYPVAAVREILLNALAEDSVDDAERRVNRAEARADAAGRRARAV